MPVNMSEAIVKIKEAGATNVRVVPMPGQSITEGQYQIEVNTGGWTTIAIGLTKRIADDIVAQALNRVICG